MKKASSYLTLPALGRKDLLPSEDIQSLSDPSIPKEKISSLYLNQQNLGTIDLFPSEEI